MFCDDAGVHKPTGLPEVSKYCKYKYIKYVILDNDNK